MIDNFVEVGTGNVKIEEYLEILSSKEPVPGGGGAAGFVGAIAASLGVMVCNLTSGKKKYADYQSEIEELIVECETLRDKLLAEADEDAHVFEPLSKAYGLPAEIEEEKAYKERVLEECLDKAARAPLAMIETLNSLLIKLDRLSVIGSRLAISDVGVAATFARSCTEAAALNVFINTKLMKNESVKNDLNNRTLALVSENAKLGETIYLNISNSLRNI